jgi:hypothetical protein
VIRPITSPNNCNMDQSERTSTHVRTIPLTCVYWSNEPEHYCEKHRAPSITAATECTVARLYCKQKQNRGFVCSGSTGSLLASRSCRARALYPTEILLRCLQHKTIILPLVLHGCETCSLTLREEHKLGVFENRVLRSIFRPKRDRVTGGWRKLHNEELHNLYSSPSIIRI